MKPDYILFTDGSCIQDRAHDTNYAAYAFLVINNHKSTSTRAADTIGDADSATAELAAIVYGLDYIRSKIKKDQHKSILVLTDNMYSITFITKIGKKWIRGKPLSAKVRNRISMNSELYHTLKKIMLDKRLSLTFVHINSHLKYNDYHIIVRRVLEAGYIISGRTAKQIIKFNSIVDEMAHNSGRNLARECGFYSKSGFMKLVERKEQEKWKL